MPRLSYAYDVENFSHIERGSESEQKRSVYHSGVSVFDQVPRNGSIEDGQGYRTRPDHSTSLRLAHSSNDAQNGFNQNAHQPIRGVACSDEKHGSWHWTHPPTSTGFSVSSERYSYSRRNDQSHPPSLTWTRGRQECLSIAKGKRQTQTTHYYRGRGMAPISDSPSSTDRRYTSYPFKSALPTLEHEVPVSVSNEDPPTPPDLRSPRGAVFSEKDSRYTGKRALLPRMEVQVKRTKGFDKFDLLVSATLEIGPLQENPTGCSCPKSKCVALYCDCFKAGRRCNPINCNCTACKNTINESGPQGARTNAIRAILARNPRAFVTAGVASAVQKLPAGQVACNCIRSRCLKLYCTCFQAGKMCQPGICTCIACANSVEDHPERKQAIKHTLQKRPDAFQTKDRPVGLGCACKNNKCIRKYCECFRNGLSCADKCCCLNCENRKVESMRTPSIPTRNEMV